MLASIIRLSIRFRGAAIALAFLSVGYGVYMAMNSRLDVYPEFAPPQVVVQTEAPGLASEQVEQLVTRPIENAINGSPGLESIRSQSIQGLSVVTVFFSDRTDVFRARQMISERLNEVAAQLPQGVEPPGMAPLTGATSLVLIVGLTSDTRSPMDLRTLAGWTLRPRLLAVPGVARVSIFGGDVRQLQIQASPGRMAALNVALNDVISAGRASTGVRGAGFIETPAERVIVQTRGQAASAAALGEAIIRTDRGVPLRLKDVARVIDGVEPRIGDAAIGGTRGVLVEVSSQYGANTLEVTEAIERALSEMTPAIEREGVKLHPALFRPANFITAAIHNVNSSLLLGGVLVSAVLFLFLLNVRTALISLTAIPLSLLAAVIVLGRIGISLNTLTLGGLAIAIGEVVDDAIIDVENIFRRLRENRALGSPRSAFRVVLDASLEVRGAVVYATFVVMLVFLPVLFMSGIEGRLFAPLAIAYLLAIFASLTVAVGLTPGLSYALLANRELPESEPRFIRTMKAGYRRLLAGLMERPAPVVAAVVGLCAAAALMIPFFGGAFLPDLNEGHLIVHMAALPGTSIDESLRIGQRVSQELLKSPFVVSTAQQVGRAELADDTWGPHYSEIHVTLNTRSADDTDQAESGIRAALVKFPGLNFAIRPFLAERIEEVLSGVTASVVIKIFGDDLEKLDGAARDIAQVVSGVSGAADVQLESPPGSPVMAIDLRTGRLQQLGFRPVDVLDAVQAAYQGAIVAQTYEANRVFNVAVILDDRNRRNPEDIGSLLLSNGNGGRVPLKEIATVTLSSGRYAILHEAARRRQAVTANVRGRDVSSFVHEVEKQVAARVKFPAGTYAVYSGAEQARERAQRDLLLNSLAAGFAILVLLSLVFRHPRNLLLVLVNLPFALVGGVIAVFFTGGWLTVGSMVGFVTLFGITMRNSMMLISHFEHLVEREDMTWGIEAAIRGASERLVPVLMTAIVTALGLLPLALGSGDPGREIEGPMAIVILGGLVTSTILNLTVLPALALRHGRFVMRVEEE